MVNFDARDFDVYHKIYINGQDDFVEAGESFEHMKVNDHVKISKDYQHNFFKPNKDFVGVITRIQKSGLIDIAHHGKNYTVYPDDILEIFHS